jgi:hypothetical protein
VAKQLTLPSPGAPVEYESLDQDEVISISGHDNVSLDLAPYKLNSRETLSARGFGARRSVSTQTL